MRILKLLGGYNAIRAREDDQAERLKQQADSIESLTMKCSVLLDMVTQMKQVAK